jgi:replicative DNA helicase
VSRTGTGPVVRAYFASSSPELAKGVRRALLRLGIGSRMYRARKGGYRESWHVALSGHQSQTQFFTQIGCQGARGLRIPECLEILAARTANRNVDVVPWEVSPAVKSALTASGMTQRQLAQGLGEHYCGSNLLGSTHRPRCFSRARLARIAALTDSTELAELAGSDVSWDRVVEVTALGDMPTFDATVEGTHNFIAEGVVAHNSLEQDADVVMFLYRDEVYNSESPDRGTAEVIISKHRNGPTGITHLAFLDHYTRFANMARV